MKMFQKLILAALVISLNACAWVELTPTGEKVRVLSKAEVSGCKHVGKTHVKTAGKIVGGERYLEKVQEELDILARNSAPEIGGDTVVRIGQPEDGKQVYEVYRCMPPAK